VTLDEPYQILPAPGFPPAIGRVVSMMNHARARTIKAVESLTIAQLDYLHDTASNSIGALLTHMTAIESVHAVLSFENRPPAARELAQWGDALKLGDAARAKFKGKDLAHYLAALETVRSASLDGLRSREDSWLYEERPYIEGKKANNLYIWFHVLEDETNHRGQISWLRKRLPV
jgi:uncharacterized damage-inducible protein DinB